MRLLRSAFLFLIFFAFSLHAQERTYKIYDCFLFFNEIDTLKIRLRELYDKVDYFVLVECDEAFRGTIKNLYFEQNREEFAAYLDKIIYVRVADKFQPGNSDPWGRETYQRNQICRGLVGCRDEDIVIISDVDEIIRAENVEGLIASLCKTKRPIVGCHCEMYRHFYNRKDAAYWCGSAVTTFGYLKQKSPQFIRDHRDKHFLFPQGGWHFTSMGGFKAYLEKINSDSHYRDRDRNTPGSRNPYAVYNVIKRYELVQIDDRFPKYVVENLEYFREEGLIDEGQGYGDIR